MAAPRSFRSETWFVKLPDGHVEVVPGAELERTYRAGLASASTPVRASGSAVWTTLATELEEAAPSSLSPIAVDTRTDESLALQLRGTFRAGTYGEHRAIRRGRRAPVVVALALAVAAIAGIGSRWSRDLESASVRLTSVRPSLATPSPFGERPAPIVKDAEAELASARIATRHDQVRQAELERALRDRAWLRTLEMLRRRRGPSSRTAIDAPARTEDPFARIANLDPLNGAL